MPPNRPTDDEIHAMHFSETATAIAIKVQPMARTARTRAEDEKAKPRTRARLSDDTHRESYDSIQEIAKDSPAFTFLLFQITGNSIVYFTFGNVPALAPTGAHKGISTT